MATAKKKPTWRITLHKDGRITSIYVQGVADLIKGLWD